MTADSQISFLEPKPPDGRSAETAISVAALTESTRRLLEDRIPRLWVRGEVANWRRPASGHRYFTLRDDRAQVACVMFRGDAWRLPTDPEEGLEVTVFGQPTLYAERGRYQVIVRELRASGEGLWRIAFEKLRRTLAAEGLLDPARKRSLPPFPRRIGVVTSRDGAALRDVVTVLRRRSPWVDVVVCDCRVQGEAAAAEIRDALERVVQVADLDVVILTRGGGSIEDLWSFNEEIVARAVAACPLPVVCGVGHEVDVTLAELVADVRAPTPSVAAELAAPDRATVDARLDGYSQALARGLRSRLDRGRLRVEAVERELPRLLRSRLDRGRLRVEAIERELPRLLRSRFEEAAGNLAELSGRLHALSPLAVLARGYAVATDAEGRLLSRAGDFGAGDPFRLRVRDARVEATVDAVETIPAEEGT